jgi:hypothetical protein
LNQVQLEKKGAAAINAINLQDRISTSEVGLGGLLLYVAVQTYYRSVDSDTHLPSPSTARTFSSHAHSETLELFAN